MRKPIQKDIFVVISSTLMLCEDASCVMTPCLEKKIKYSEFLNIWMNVDESSQDRGTIMKAKVIRDMRCTDFFKNNSAISPSRIDSAALHFHLLVFYNPKYI